MTRLLPAHVQDGVIVAEGLDLPDGTAVTIAVNDTDGECNLSAPELAVLDSAIVDADADDSEPTPHADVLTMLGHIAAAR